MDDPDTHPELSLLAHGLIAYFYRCFWSVNAQWTIYRQLTTARLSSFVDLFVPLNQIY